MERPISPHLTIYKPQISSVLSITHRATGVALYAGALVMVCWLVLAAYYPGHYVEWHGYAMSPVGRILLLGWTLSFFFHFANGVRHLFWDIGTGYTLPVMHKSGVAVVVFTIAASLGVWYYAYYGLDVTGLTLGM